MNAERLLYALGDIDDDLILDAAQALRPDKKRRAMGIGLAAAACLVLLAGVLLLHPFSGKSGAQEHTFSSIRQIEEAYDGTLLIESFLPEDAQKMDVRLRCDGDGDIQNADGWKTLSVSAQGTDYAMEMNCVFDGETIQEELDGPAELIYLESHPILVYRAPKTEMYAFVYRALFEYEGVRYELTTKSNDPGRMQALLQAALKTPPLASADDEKTGLYRGEFQSLMGFDDYYVQSEEVTPGYCQWRYYAQVDGEDRCIAQAGCYLPNRPETFSIDLDGDGVQELICNVEYGTGARRVAVYRNKNGRIEEGFIDEELLMRKYGMKIWGSSAIAERYDIDTGAFVVENYASDGEKIDETVYISDPNELEFIDFVP